MGNQGFEATFAAAVERRLGRIRRGIVKKKLVDLLREENPQYAALWRKVLSENKPKSPLERSGLRGKVKEEYDKMPPWKKAPLSLDVEMKNEEGETVCLGDLIPSEKGLGFINEVERGAVLDALIEKAKLPKRQSFRSTGNRGGWHWAIAEVPFCSDIIT